jgi:hypothetical protein
MKDNMCEERISHVLSDRSLVEINMYGDAPSAAPSQEDLEECPFPAGGMLQSCPGGFNLYKTSDIENGEACSPYKCEEQSKIQELAEKYPGKYSCDCEISDPVCPDKDENVPKGICTEGYQVFETDKVIKGECEPKCKDFEDLIIGFAENKYLCDCTPPPPGAGDICETCGKPQYLQFELLAESCTGLACNSMDKAVVTTTGNVDGGAVKWSAGNGQTGEVSTGGFIELRVGDGGKFDSNLLITLDAAGGTQVVDFHTSCSSPIIRDDKYGRLKLVGYNELPDKTGCGFIP